ncbi:MULTISPECIES: holin family protein [Bacillus]|uniref:phage holin family protein n=1 Tax=Bacillus TaxID=1386 RepID=UPI002280E4F5|nr:MULTISPECIES: phage holin family protein [Bacillus]MCY8180906.1 phage holin family protein [Bacillus paralicheniformis]MCY8664893.1 phage holin family protein [Bacillus haynesii]MCY8712481.1 phage holin family protein [Bacillus haynesii]
MRQNTDTLYASFAGGSTSILAYLFGGLDHLLTAFIIFMAVDYLTGIAAAWKDKTVSSGTAFGGLLKKGAMLLLIIVATQVDIILGNDGQFARYAMIMFLIGMEGISFIENLSRLGVPVPSFLVDRFEQIKDQGSKTKDQ